MNSRIVILAAALAAPASGLFAEQTTEIREDFEKIVPTVKGLDKYYMNHVRDGWDFGRGPVVFHPTKWRPTCGSGGRFYAIDCSEDETLKPFVRSGVGSLPARKRSVSGRRISLPVSTPSTMPSIQQTKSVPSETSPARISRD